MLTYYTEQTFFIVKRLSGVGSKLHVPSAAAATAVALNLVSHLPHFSIIGITSWCNNDKVHGLKT